jgi:hypothetical protein
MDYICTDNFYPQVVTHNSQYMAKHAYFTSPDELCVITVENESLTDSTTGMSHLKIIEGGQTYIHCFTNLKSKLYNCNDNTFFNRAYPRHKIAPHYAKINIPNTSKASIYIRKKCKSKK